MVAGPLRGHALRDDGLAQAPFRSLDESRLSRAQLLSGTCDPDVADELDILHTVEQAGPVGGQQAALRVMLRVLSCVPVQLGAHQADETRNSSVYEALFGGPVSTNGLRAERNSTA